MPNLLSYRITLHFSALPVVGDQFTCPGHAGIERRWEIIDFIEVVPSTLTVSVKAVGLPYYDNFKYKVDGQL